MGFGGVRPNTLEALFYRRRDSDVLLFLEDGSTGER